jgi:hypothetical protein
MKKIVLIQSHCDTPEKLECLKDNLIKLKKFNVDILVFSHISLPQEILELTDYFIFDKSNPILWEEKRWMHWKNIENLKLIQINPDYSWTVFNQIIKSGNFALNLNYDYYYIFCYDLLITPIVEDSLINPHPLMSFKHVKPNVTFDTSLIFAVFDKQNFKNLIPKLVKEEYISHMSIKAEDFFELKLKEFPNYVNNPNTVSDIFHESVNVFNQNLHNNYFKVHLQNTNLFKAYFYDVNTNFIFIVNDQTYNISNSQLIEIDILPQQITNLGYFINSQYYNLLPEYNKLVSLEIKFI